jgi:hypothetical protein
MNWLARSTIHLPFDCDVKWLSTLRPIQQASVSEVLLFIERERLFCLGCGFVDDMLLASVLMTPDAQLWTLDKRLDALAERFGVAHRPSVH